MSAISELNDKFRRTLMGGHVTVTDGIAALPHPTQVAIRESVQSFSRFDEDNYPHGEHDFGAFDIDGVKVFWKIDYYDKGMRHGSPSPADPKRTIRVLTIMLSSEY
jgi:hypothetical protein